MDERELRRKARLHRFHKRTWWAFWSEHRDEIRAAFPDPRKRMDLIHRLQEVILLGTSGEPVRELPA